MFEYGWALKRNLHSYVVCVTFVTVTLPLPDLNSHNFTVRRFILVLIFVIAMYLNLV